MEDKEPSKRSTVPPLRTNSEKTKHCHNTRTIPPSVKHGATSSSKFPNLRRFAWHKATIMSSTDAFDTWFPAASKQGPFCDGQPKLRLLCFPSSGTMEATFTQKTRGADRKLCDNVLMTWAKNAGVEVLSVQLPGRGKRHKEPFLNSIEAVASELTPLLAPRLISKGKDGHAVPYAVLGHSMGCWAGYECVHALSKAGVPPPTLFLAACFPAPDLALRDRPWAQNAAMTEGAFKEECRGWDINDSVLNTPHVWASFQKMIRADFTLFDEFPPAQTPNEEDSSGGGGGGGAADVGQLMCPIVACGATGDKRISEALLREWRRFTPCGFEMAPPAQGHHLFLLDEKLKAAWFEQTVIPVLAAKALTPPPLAKVAVGTPAVVAAAAAAAAAAGPETTVAEALAEGAPATSPSAGGPPPPPQEAAGEEDAAVAPIGASLESARVTTGSGDVVSGSVGAKAASLRVLCLHGFGCCGDIFKKQTERLRSLVEAELSEAAATAASTASGTGTYQGIEWDFLDSPSEVCWDPSAFEARLITSYFPGLQNLQWMRRVNKAQPDGPTVLSDGNKLAAASECQRYVDWEGSLRFVLAHCAKKAAKHGPYDVVMGFSQGANLAVLLTALQERAPPEFLLRNESGVAPPPPPQTGAGQSTNLPQYSSATPPHVPALFRTAVVICGCAFGWEQQWATCGQVLPEWGVAGSSDGNSGSDGVGGGGGGSVPLFDAPLTTPSIHLIGTSDPLKPASEALAATLFDKGSAVVVPFTSGHKPPTQKAAAMALAAFMKKNLLL